MQSKVIPYNTHVINPTFVELSLGFMNMVSNFVLILEVGLYLTVWRQNSIYVIIPSLQPPKKESQGQFILALLDHIVRTALKF